MTLTEAMATKFQVVKNGERQWVAGMNASDALLEKYSQNDNVPAENKQAALLLLAHTTASVVAGKTLRAAKPTAAPAAPLVPPPTQPKTAPEPDEYQQFLAQEAEAPMAMPMAAVPIRVAEQPEWAKRIEGKLDAVIDAFQLIIASSKDKPQPTAAGVGQGGGNLFVHATRVVIEHKNDKVYLNFWDDDDERLKYSVIYGAKSAKEWAKLLPWVNPSYFSKMSDKEWFKAFPEAEKVGQFECHCNVYYTLSDKLNGKGNPFKDIQRIEKA